MNYKGYLRVFPDTKTVNLKAHKFNKIRGEALGRVGAHNALHCFFPINFFMHVEKVDAYYSYVSAFVFGYSVLIFRFFILLFFNPFSWGV